MVKLDSCVIQLYSVMTRNQRLETQIARPRVELGSPGHEPGMLAVALHRRFKPLLNRFPADVTSLDRIE